MALVANCHRSSKTKPFKPVDFNPTVEKKKKLLTKEEFRAMCQKFFRTGD